MESISNQTNETAVDSQPLIAVRGLSKQFAGASGVTALDGINFEIARGERVAIMGPSGSGKSTLLNLLCGLDSTTMGSVIFDGRDLLAMSDDERTRLRREKIGMIFQTFNLLPTLNGTENVALPLRLSGMSNRDASARAGAMLKRVGLDTRSAHRPDEMSGGERQRVAVARALIFSPLMLLADEPTGNLDSKTGDEVLAMLDDLHREYGMTLVIVTHDESAASFCNRRINLLDGRVIGDETTLEPGANLS